MDNLAQEAYRTKKNHSDRIMYSNLKREHTYKIPKKFITSSFDAG